MCHFRAGERSIKSCIFLATQIFQEKATTPCWRRVLKKIIFIYCVAHPLHLPQDKITTLISFLQKKADPVPPGLAFFVLYPCKPPVYCPGIPFYYRHGPFLPLLCPPAGALASAAREFAQNPQRNIFYSSQSALWTLWLIFSFYETITVSSPWKSHPAR